jgi:hypothetical protein
VWEGPPSHFFWPIGNDIVGTADCDNGGHSAGDGRTPARWEWSAGCGRRSTSFDHRKPHWVRRGVSICSVVASLATSFSCQRFVTFQQRLSRVSLSLPKCYQMLVQSFPTAAMFCPSEKELFFAKKKYGETGESCADSGKKTRARVFSQQKALAEPEEISFCG